MSVLFGLSRFRGFLVLLVSTARLFCFVQSTEADSCKSNLDLVFLVDGSRSIELYGDGNFRDALKFVKAVIDDFRFDHGRVRAGLTLFSTKVEEVFGLDRYKVKPDMFAAIDAVKFPDAGSDLGKALEWTRRETFNFTTEGVSRIVVVLSDGKSKDEIVEPSKKLAEKGVHILMVTVGDNLDLVQLEQVVGGDEDDIFDFNSFQKLVERINMDVCNGRLIV